METDVDDPPRWPTAPERTSVHFRKRRKQGNGTQQVPPDRRMFDTHESSKQGRLCLGRLRAQKVNPSDSELAELVLRARWLTEQRRSRTKEPRNNTSKRFKTPGTGDTSRPPMTEKV